MRDKDDADATANAEARRRKPYRAPRLERLGTLTELTAAVGTHGKSDMSGGPRKTS